MEKQILEILEKYSDVYEETDEYNEIKNQFKIINANNFEQLTAELSQLISKPSVLDKLIDDMTEEDIERVVNPVDLRKELTREQIIKKAKVYQDEYGNQNISWWLSRDGIAKFTADFIIDELSRPDSKVDEK